MSWSCSYSSSLWLSSQWPPWSMPYLCLKQVGVVAVFYVKGGKRFCKLYKSVGTICSFCSSKDQILHISPHLFPYIDYILSLFWSCQKKKISPALAQFLSSSLLSQRVCMCSTVFWSCCAIPSPCSGTVFVSWSGTIAAWWGWSWQVKTQLMTASYVDEWIHFTERGNWVGHQTICHRHTGIRCSAVKENCRHVIELNELYTVTKAYRWLQRASHTYMHTSCVYPWVYPSTALLGL